MFCMCYVKHYSASFNEVIKWLDIFGHLFQKYIIIFYISYYFLFAMYYIQKNITCSRNSNLFHAFDLKFIFKISLVLPLGYKVINIKKLHSKKLKC